MSRGPGRLLGAAGVGAFLGAAFWLHGGVWNGHPLPLGLSMSAGALAGMLLSLCTNLPLFGEAARHEREAPADARAAEFGLEAPATAAPPAASGACPHCGAPRGAAEAWCMSCGRLMGRSRNVDEADIARLVREETAAVPAHPSWSTALAAILLAAVAIPAVPRGDWALRKGLELGRAEGTPFWWGLDGLVQAAAGLVLLILAATIAAFVAVALAGAVGLLRRAAWTRTAALCVFVTGAVTAGAALTVAPSPEMLAIFIAAAAGAVLLFLPSTGRDFGGRWGSWLLTRARKW